MTKEELKEFLKENLKLGLYKKYVDNDDVKITLSLQLGDDVISEQSFWTKE